MIRDIALGQYIPGDSLVHRLDPRVKIVLIFLFIVFLFVAQNFVSLLLLVVSVLLSGVPLRQYLKSVKAILFIVLFTSVLNLFYGGGETLLKIGFMEIKSGGVSNAVFITVRIVSLILLSAVLTFTTSPTSLTDAIERLMKPLKVFHVKVHEIAMMMTIALRFVPTLLEETDKIMSAQKARGADLESGGFAQRAKALLPMLSWRRGTHQDEGAACRRARRCGKRCGRRGLRRRYCEQYPAPRRAQLREFRKTSHIIDKCLKNSGYNGR